jgi:TPP-dependent pyruvate/acetoin dehydrogenase alpha subunit
VDEGSVTDARLEELALQAHAEVEDAAAWALESPYPDASDAIEDVYAPAEWLTPGRLS